ncbi:MAG TPA: dethiobiotin synthase [Acidothermaceae bacterium]|nr:dethiobiotin synthase [Acidothermaceae bacterium]
MTPLRGPVVVTGTDTGVGKTVVTAAVAAAATSSGLRVAVVKPCQTGVALGEEPDADVVARLAAPASSMTLLSYPDPLAPSTAARVAGLPMLALGSVLGVVTSLAAQHDLVLIEGAGGLLVSLGSGDWTIADLAVSLGAPAIVVARPELGTLNHTALTREALDERGVEHRLVLGSWPASPGLVHRTNLRDLPALSGVLPAGAGSLPSDEFQRAARGWLAAELHGDWQADSLATLAL